MNKKELKEYCLLWVEARDAAVEKGLHMSERCPMQDVCSSDRCTFIDPKQKVKGIIYKDNEPIVGC